jgi:NADH-quinone oxidoreductase subunit J
MALLLLPKAQMISPHEVGFAWSAPMVIFCLFAALTFLGAVATILQKNDVGAVMSLVASFFGLAGIYTFLDAHFIAVLQVLVYAGAIMVLFIFVVMVLNRDETDPWVWRGWLGKVVIGGGPMVYILFKLSSYLRVINAVQPAKPSDDFGTVAQIGELLFTDYLFAFEAISVLLLIAVIAAVVVARTSKVAERATGPTPPPDHRYGDAHTGRLYDETAVPTPPGAGGGL